MADTTKLAIADLDPQTEREEIDALIDLALEAGAYLHIEVRLES